MKEKLKQWLDKGILTRSYIKEAEGYELDTLAAEMQQAMEITGKEAETLFVMAEADMKGHKTPYLIHALRSVITKLGFDGDKLQIPMLPFTPQVQTKQMEEPIVIKKREIPRPKFFIEF
jgi:hypothetical protein